MTDLPKHLQVHMSRREWPQLLIFDEKHSNRYFLCKDQEAVGRACLIILAERIDPAYGYIQHPGPESDLRLEPELTKEEIEKLPEKYRKKELATVQTNARERRDWAEAVELFENAHKAVANKDGNLAYMILNDRSDYEYEGFSFEAPIIP